MVNLTVRNIPDIIIDKIRSLSKTERRSINNEIIIILEKGLENVIKNEPKTSISYSAQIEMWEELSGKWEDNRTTNEIVNDILNHRTHGRKVNL
ncbi:MAG: hypothetical protein JW982_12840 [Spirochaetes bacterium]|nr:hypothetical protein [Spirochaetota bacterium]